MCVRSRLVDLCHVWPMAYVSDLASLLGALGQGGTHLRHTCLSQVKVRRPASHLSLCHVLVTPRHSWLMSFVFDLLMCEISQRPLTSRQTRLTGVKIYYLRRPPRPPDGTL